MPDHCPSLADFVADHLGRSSLDLARRWLEELHERLGVRRRRVLPSEALLDHIPEVVHRLAESLRSSGDGSMGVRVVVEEMRRLARLRREQGYDIQELLYETELLGRVLHEAMLEAVAAYPGECDPVLAAETAGRLHRGLMGFDTILAGVFREIEDEQRGRLARLLGDFGQTLSHELREPLYVIRLAAQMLENDGVAANGADRREYTAGIRKALDDLETLIADVRALALGADSPARREPLAAVIEGVLEEVRLTAERQGVAVELDGEPPDVEIDATRVELALLNLVSNAVKYADPAKPRRWVRLRVTPEEDERAWRIEVADNGLGIPREAQPRIFARFVRAHPQAAEGSGLGLYIAREAVEQLGGRIRFESEPGEGSRFEFTVPIGRSGAEREAAGRRDPGA